MAKMGHDNADPPLPPHSPPTPYFASTVAAPIEDPQPPAYILLPAFPDSRRGRRRRLSSCCNPCFSFLSTSLLSFTALLALIALTIFLIWPSDPDLRVVRLGIDRIHVVTDPAVAVSIDLRLRIRVGNPDFFSLDFDAIDVAIDYRGERLGSVRAAGGHIRSRDVSYVDAELRLDGIQVLHDVLYLIEDLARGSVSFDTVTEVKGLLHFLFLDMPIKARVSCTVDVNPADQTIIRQDCYPE